MSTHAYFLHYGPATTPWPRLLVIGREPNDDRDVGDEIGTYDLRGSGANKVAFWTWSHKAVERAAAIPGLKLWERAKRVRSSPIAYADASPIGRKVGSKDQPPSVTDDQLRAHAVRLVRCPAVRACLVVIVSGRKSEWAAFYDTALPELALMSHVVEVPFFGRGTKGAIAEMLADPLCRPDIQPIIKLVVDSWMLATDPEVHETAGNRFGGMLSGYGVHVSPSIDGLLVEVTRNGDPVLKKLIPRERIIEAVPIVWKFIGKKLPIFSRKKGTGTQTTAASTGSSGARGGRRPSRVTPDAAPKPGPRARPASRPSSGSKLPS